MVHAEGKVDGVGVSGGGEGEASAAAHWEKGEVLLTRGI